MKIKLFNNNIGKVGFSTLGMKIGYFMNFSVPAMIERILKNSLIRNFGSNNFNNSNNLSNITLLNRSLESRPEFFEWLCGFTDGEGNFYFGRSTHFYQFFFQI